MTCLITMLMIPMVCLILFCDSVTAGSSSIPHKCPGDKVYKECGTACPITCENINEQPVACPAMCVSGCFCPHGTVEHGKKCVKPAECPKKNKLDKCEGIQCEWPDCGEGVEPIVDDKHCCPYCPITRKCPGDKVYQQCGTACPITCKNINDPPVACPLMCVPGCFCPHGTVEHGKKCVEPAECPKKKHCTVNGVTYPNGATFIAPDGCNICKCTNGIAACTKKGCAPCVVDGETHPSGSTFPAPDGCNTCFCSDGRAGCTLMACAPCVVNGETHPSGSIFIAPDGCNTCKCINGNAACTLKACLPCVVDGETYPSGSTFTAPDCCNTCKCLNGKAACTRMACAPCVVDGETHPSGSTFIAPDGCNTCSCCNGQAACTQMACAPCVVDGESYPSGSTFPAPDGCNTCYCSNGSAACTLMACLET